VLNSHIYFLSTEYPRDENRKSFQENINQFCKYLITRQDLLSEPMIKNFFQIELPSPFGMVFENSISNIMNDFAPTNMNFYNNGNHAIITIKSIQPVSYFDEMVSISASALKAAVKICRVNWQQRYQIFDEILSIDLVNRVSTTLFLENEKKVIIGFENGDVAIYNTSNNQHIKTVKTMEDPILKIREGNKDIFVVTFNNIKILDGKSYEVVGGGSLKKRLGKDKIEAFEVIPSKNSILLGTSSGNMLIYECKKDAAEGKNYSLKYIQTATINEANPVSGIKANLSYLFVSSGTNISTYKIDYKTGKLDQTALFKPDEESKTFVQSQTITDFYYFSEQRVIIGAYSNGRILTWSVKNGQVLGIRESQAQRGLNFAFCEEKMKMITYGYEDVIEVWKIQQS